MCETYLINGTEVSTQGEFARAIGCAVTCLTMDRRYVFSSQREGDCLCPVDVRATLESRGWQVDIADGKIVATGRAPEIPMLDTEPLTTIEKLRALMKKPTIKHADYNVSSVCAEAITRIYELEFVLHTIVGHGDITLEQAKEVAAKALAGR